MKYMHLKWIAVVAFVLGVTVVCYVSRLMVQRSEEARRRASAARFFAGAVENARTTGVLHLYGSYPEDSIDLRVVPPGIRILELEAGTEYPQGFLKSMSQISTLKGVEFDTSSGFDENTAGSLAQNASVTVVGFRQSFPPPDALGVLLRAEHIHTLCILDERRASSVDTVLQVLLTKSKLQCLVVGGWPTIQEVKILKDTLTSTRIEEISGTALGVVRGRVDNE